MVIIFLDTRITYFSLYRERYDDGQPCCAISGPEVRGRSSLSLDFVLDFVKWIDYVVEMKFVVNFHIDSRILKQPNLETTILLR